MIPDKNYDTLKKHCLTLNIPMDLDLENIDTFRINFLRLHLRCATNYKSKYNEIKELKNNLCNSKLYNNLFIQMLFISFIYKEKSSILSKIFEIILNYYRKNSFPPIKTLKNNYINYINKKRAIKFKGRINIGKSTKVCEDVKLFADGRYIKIGENCTLHPFSILRLYGGKIEIGDNCYINPYCVLYGHGGLKIGNNVLIDAHCTIIPANHIYEKVDTPIAFQPEIRRGIIIEDDVWIGTGVKILDGVRISQGSIIGAGSIVTKTTEPYSINIGSPSKKIKSRLPNLEDIKFNYESFNQQVLNYIKNIQLSNIEYKFSINQKNGNIYSTIYSYLTLYLINNFDLTSNQKKYLKEYIDNFQSEEDGLWYDPLIENDYYKNSDWWGARHLSVHIVDLFIKLDLKPKYKISYVEKYYNKKYLLDWLNTINWNNSFSHIDDIDNKIMNIGTILQYNRDYFNDKQAEESIDLLINYLKSKINPLTGMWGNYDINNPIELSRCIQFAYHLYRLFFYDKKEIKYKKILIELVIRNQNILGGFGEKIYTSACEDIDSIEFLIQLGNIENKEILNSLNKALKWILYNQNSDGGFVFRKNEKILYGHNLLSSSSNESNIFATWFRILSLVKITTFLDIKNNFNNNKNIGY